MGQYPDKFLTIITSLILYNPGNWALLPSSGLVRICRNASSRRCDEFVTGIVATRTLVVFL